MTTNTQQHAQAIADQVEAQQAIKSNVANGMAVGEQLTSANPEITGEVTDIRYRNLVNMWHRETGVQSWALPYMVPEFAKQRLPNGQSVFVFRETDLADEVRHKPEAEGFWCYLNPNHPGAARYHSMGFPKCISVPRPSLAVLEQHMEKSHKRAWATINKEIADGRRDEDRDFARQQTLALQALVERLAQGQTVEPEVVEAAVEAAQVTEVTPEVEKLLESVTTVSGESDEIEIVEIASDPAYTIECDKCDFVAGGESMAGAMSSMRAHEKREHPAQE